ncbi:hypothetical protein [Nostoc sp.]|uniref:hypothetical protein n=1 Tax=Nostoc sp. TaxID=1180 RepID=UPI002FF4C588
MRVSILMALFEMPTDGDRLKNSRQRENQYSIVTREIGRRTETHPKVRQGKRVFEKSGML